MRKRIIAALQIGSHDKGTKATVEKILDYEKDILKSNCDLLVMPEALLGGYPKGSDFGTKVGFRTDEGREEFLNYWKESIKIEGPEILALSKLAKRCNTSMIIGIIERDNTTLYCTTVFISEKGKILAKHRKLMPTASERLIWAKGDGSTLPVIETYVGKIGSAICWENYMPLLRTAMYTKGIEIWCASTVDDREIWQSSMKHIAYEGRVFLISACQFIKAPENSYVKSEKWPKDKPIIKGGSVIISPMGEIIAGPLYNEEGIISAEINLDDIVKARYDMDPTGHYSRPDIFKLSVNEEERAGIHFIKKSSE
ncbi:MAG: carbon-nitrogen hydrolase family protein [Campylobacteraceae bacterium]|nr:carbon-nitrogen hydrolase family protein [Campylobacteraceae bacterium]